MEEILVTGCNGQLGSELHELAKASGKESSFCFVDKETLDITDREAVCNFIGKHSFSTVINCAAFTAVDKAESETEACNNVNHLAPAFLAEAITAVKGRFIHISTDYVFDGNSFRPYREDDTPCPQTVYGRTKLAGEKAALQHCPDTMIIRTGWLYSSFGSNFVKTMLRLAKERHELGIVADQTGTPTYAHDLAKAILHIMEKGIIPGVYHYANEGTASWFDFAHAIHRAAGIKNTQCHLTPLHTEDYPTPARRPHYSVLDKTKIKLKYGLEIPWWEDSLKECMARL